MMARVRYFECLKDYSQAEKLQAKVSGQYVKEILLNICKSLFNICLCMYSKSCIHVGKHNSIRVNLLRRAGSENAKMS